MRIIEAIMTAIINFLFGCGHHNLTRPFTLENRTYKVCLDCGHEVAYQWEPVRNPPTPVHSRTATVLAFAPKPVRAVAAAAESNVAA